MRWLSCLALCFAIPLALRAAEPEARKDGLVGEVLIDLHRDGEETASSLDAQANARQNENDRCIRQVKIPRLGGRLRTTRSLKSDRQTRREDLEQRLFELSLQYRPEAMYTIGWSRSSVERVWRHTVAGWTPLSDRWELAAAAERADWFLDRTELDDLNERTCDLELRTAVRLRRRWRLWAALKGHRGSEIADLGVRTGMQWNHENGISVNLQGAAWIPWADNTESVANDGRMHEVTGSVAVPFLPRLTLLAEGGVSWHLLAGEGYRVRDETGYERRGTLRLDAELFRRGGRDLGPIFMDPRAETIMALDTVVLGYVAWSRSRFELYEGFDAVGVTEESLDLRLGAEARILLVRHIVVEGGGYIGRDRKREIAWSRLYGGRVRASWMPKARIRFWGEWALDSAPVNGVGGGITRTASLGMNINF